MANAQNDQPSLNVSDPAPPLRIREWLKGAPFQKFENNKLYVVEFWATWCRPCKAAMPRLSTLARKYRDKVIFLGVDVYEDKSTSLKKIQNFVDSMGNSMDYVVAKEDNDFMVKEWLEASGNPGIPQTFIINGEGKLVWIGYPYDIDTVLPKIINNEWNMKKELARRNLQRKIGDLDHSLNDEVMKYRRDRRAFDFGEPDSALFVINEAIKKVPELKYAPFTVFNTLWFLLKNET